ncbi:hypothetical protein [Paenibacillus alba]|nr:hypothetical protein [Paenibacillus alba]MEC0226731.1 hypothetical protein [Paenibacillus alba]
MKNALVIILSFVILLGTTACGNNAPANVKKGFEYYVLMDDVAT